MGRFSLILINSCVFAPSQRETEIKHNTPRDWRSSRHRLLDLFRLSIITVNMKDRFACIWCYIHYRFYKVVQNFRIFYMIYQWAHMKLAQIIQCVENEEKHS